MLFLLSYEVLFSEKDVKRRFIDHDHITLNTTIYYVTKQQIDNRKFIHEKLTILYKNAKIVTIRNSFIHHCEAFPQWTL